MSEPGYWDLLAALGAEPDYSESEPSPRLHLLATYGATRLLDGGLTKDKPDEAREYLWLGFQQAALVSDAIESCKRALPSGEELDRLILLEVWRLRLWDNLVHHARAIAPAAFASKRRPLPRRLARWKAAK